MGTHPTKRLFFRRLAVEKGENAAGGPASSSEMSMSMRRCKIVGTHPTERLFAFLHG